MKKYLIITACIALLSSCMYTRPITTDDYRNISSANYFGLVIPGLTQALNGEWLKGSIFFASLIVPSLINERFCMDGAGNTLPGKEGLQYALQGVASVATLWSIVDGIGTTGAYLKQKKEIDLARANAAMDKMIQDGSLTQKEATAIKEGGFFIGMRDFALRMSFGAPAEINRSVGIWGNHEQWVYRWPDKKTMYIYIENGVITSFQN